MTKFQRLFVWVIFVLCCADCVAYFAISMIVGDVSRGTTINGHFYFKQHGELVEVNKSGYHFAQILMVSNFLAFPLAISAGLALKNARRRSGSNKEPLIE